MVDRAVVAVHSELVVVHSHCLFKPRLEASACR